MRSLKNVALSGNSFFGMIIVVGCVLSTMLLKILFDENV